MTGFGFVYAVSALYFRPSENLPDFVTITIDQESDSVNPFHLTFQVHTHAIYLKWIFPILQFEISSLMNWCLLVVLACNFKREEAILVNLSFGFGSTLMFWTEHIRKTKTEGVNWIIKALLYTLYFYNNEPSKKKHFLILISSLARNSQEPKLKRIFEIVWVLFENLSVFYSDWPKSWI